MTKDFQSARESPSPRHPMTREADLEAARLHVDASPDGDHGLNADLRDHLGAQLRAMFQEIVTEPLPARFQHLLNEFAPKG